MDRAAGRDRPGAFLTFGIATRLWAVVGGVHATVIALCVLRLRGEWPWSYYLMTWPTCSCSSTAAGRFAGIDGVVLVLATSRARFARLWWKVS